MNYKIFTKTHDVVMSASECMQAKGVSREDLDRDTESLDKEFSANHIDIDVGAGGPVTILIEASGSMYGDEIRKAAASAIMIGDALNEVGRAFEILAHTTMEWKGGQSKKDWVEAGRPVNPGRLNDLLHLVIKGSDQDWESARGDVALITMKSVLRENIDGEALQWAASRMRSHDDPGCLIVISDGPPLDDATMAFNNFTTLTDHLREVLDEISEIPMRRIILGDQGVTNINIVWPDEVRVASREWVKDMWVKSDASEIVAEIARAANELGKEPEDPAP